MCCEHLVATSFTVKDQASKDSRAAAEGKIDDPGAKPLKAVVTRLPEKWDRKPYLRSFVYYLCILCFTQLYCATWGPRASWIQPYYCCLVTNIGCLLLENCLFLILIVKFVFAGRDQQSLLASGPLPRPHLPILATSAWGRWPKSMTAWQNTA